MTDCTPQQGAEALHRSLERLRMLSKDYRWRVLVVDDDAGDTSFLVELLGPYRCEIQAADNPDLAILLINTQKFDIVFLDVKMPPRNGMRVLKTIRETKPDQRFVIVTGYEDAALREQAMQLGASLYIIKPVTESHVREIFGYVNG